MEPNTELLDDTADKIAALRKQIDDLTDTANFRAGSPTTESIRRTYTFYQKMKETNPRLYLDRKTAIAMERDAQVLGADFFDD